MYGTILSFIKLNNYSTQHICFIHSAALPSVYLSPCMYMSPVLIRINTVSIKPGVTNIIPCIIITVGPRLSESPLSKASVIQTLLQILKSFNFQRKPSNK